MEALFVLARLLMLPVPLILWTLTWPILLIGAIATIPFRWFFTTLFRLLGVPFVFLGAAFSGEPEDWHTYCKNWSAAYDSALSLVKEVRVEGVYQDILKWCWEPKNAPDPSWIIVANFIVAVVVVCVMFEAVRTVVIWTVVVLAVLLIWANST